MRILNTPGRIRVNNSVAFPLQHPVVTARTLSSMDWLSSGRITVTLGVGWLKEEFDALSVPFSKRGAGIHEYVKAIVALWSQERLELEGKYVSCGYLAFEPKCVQTPYVPIWFGGDGDLMLGRVARNCSGWWPLLTKPEDIPARIDSIKSQRDCSNHLQDIFDGVSSRRAVQGRKLIEDGRKQPELGQRQIIHRWSRCKEMGTIGVNRRAALAPRGLWIFRPERSSSPCSSQASVRMVTNQLLRMDGGFFAQLIP